MLHHARIKYGIPESAFSGSGIFFGHLVVGPRMLFVFPAVRGERQMLVIQVL